MSDADNIIKGTACLRFLFMFLHIQDLIQEIMGNGMKIGPWQVPFFEELSGHR